MKTLKNFLYATLLVLIIINIFLQYNVCAYDMMGNINSIAGATSVTGATDAITSSKNIAGAIITVTRVVTAGVAIIMISILAMKYMTAAPSEKADIKKHAIPYVVGAIIMFSVTGILGILQNFAGIFD